MDIIGKETTGDVIVEKDTQYNILMAENVTVSPNTTVRLYGIIKKNLILKPGSTAHLHGMIMGKLINEGGVLHSY